MGSSCCDVDTVNRGDELADKGERGDMTCALVSKDRLSMERYNKVNRSFLKRIVKEEEKRFRIILIYKPDKVDKPKKMEKPANEEKKVEAVG